MPSLKQANMHFLPRDMKRLSNSLNTTHPSVKRRSKQKTYDQAREKFLSLRKGTKSDVAAALEQYSMFGSIMTFGGIFGAIFSGKVADLMGRKGTMVCSSFLHFRLV